MKNNTSRKWLAAIALAFVIATLALQFQSARAQYGNQAPPAQDISTSMIERGGFLYIMQSGPYDRTLHKIREKDLAVMGRINLVPAATPYPMSMPTAVPQGTPTVIPEPDVSFGVTAGQNGNQ